MPIQYKIDVLNSLNEAGYTTYRIRKEKLIGEAALMNLRNGEMISMKTLETICRLLHKQPGDVLVYTEES